LERDSILDGLRQLKDSFAEISENRKPKKLFGRRGRCAR
jgi:hypothetical protein